MTRFKAHVNDHVYRIDTFAPHPRQRHVLYSTLGMPHGLVWNPNSDDTYVDFEFESGGNRYIIVFNSRRVGR